MKVITTTMTMAAAILSIAAPARPAGVVIPIVNGSFEADDWSSGERLDLGATGGPATGWTITDPLRDSLYPWGIHNDTNQYNAGPTPYGEQWFIIGGPAGAGGISVEQAVSGLTPGTTYTLSYSLSTEGFTGGNCSVRVSFPSGSSTPSTDIIIPPSVNTYWDTWTPYSTDFVADSSTVTFRFTDLGSPDGLDAGLDNVSLEGPESSVTPFCFGDGTDVDCPCANNGAPGNGCANSDHPGGANLSTNGTPSLSNDTLVLTVTDMHASSLALFIQGDFELAPTAFGDGLRCINGRLKRLFKVKQAHSSTVSAPSAGSLPPSPATVSGQSAAKGDPLSAGDIRGYQVYYRDPVRPFCDNPPGDNYNITNAVRVTWGP